MVQLISSVAFALLVAIARRADETIRPTPLLHRRPAQLLRSVEALEFDFTETLLELHFVTSHGTTPLHGSRLFLFCIIIVPLRQVQSGISLNPLEADGIARVIGKEKSRRAVDPSYFAGSVGGAPLSVLKQYIEQQKGAATSPR
jgi:hypothetical protein